MSISNNQENISNLFQALNKTNRRVNKLEKKTVGVNENEKNYNYDDSLERLFVITNTQTTRLDKIEERLDQDGPRSNYSRRNNRRRVVARRGRRRGGRRTRRRRRKKRTRKRRKSRRKRKR